MAHIIPFPAAATAAQTQTEVIDSSVDEHEDELLRGRDSILKVSNQLEAILLDLRLALGGDLSGIAFEHDHHAGKIGSASFTPNDRLVEINDFGF